MKIDLDAATVPLQTVMVYGAYRTGKTHLCATFPKVLWLGAPREGGYKTIAHMSRSAFPGGVRPDCRGVVGFEELRAVIETEAPKLVAAKRIETICVELSVFSDDVIRHDESVGWEKYSNLIKIMIYLDEKIKKAQEKVPHLRLVYNALMARVEDDKRPAGPLMAGRGLAEKLPALCDAIIYTRADTIDGKADYVQHHAQWGNYPAGNRYGAKLPPLTRNASFTDLVHLIEGRASVDSDGRIVREESTENESLTPPAKAGNLRSLRSK